MHNIEKYVAVKNDILKKHEKKWKGFQTYTHIPIHCVNHVIHKIYASNSVDKNMLKKKSMQFDENQAKTF